MEYDRCGYTWFAPRMLPSGQEGQSQEKCYLKIGHEGDHRSLGQVTAPNPVDQRKETDGR